MTGSQATGGPEPPASDRAQTDPAPRFEFRVFGADLSGPRGLLERDGRAEPPEHRRDTYFVARDRFDIGLKLRGAGDRLELKRLVRVEGRCELWEPAASSDLPLEVSEIPRALLAPLGLPDGLAPQAVLDGSALLEALDGREDLRVVPIGKHRTTYHLGPDLGEWVQIDFPDGHREVSVALESEDLTRLEALIDRMDLGGRENVSLPRRLIAFASSPG